MCAVTMAPLCKEIPSQECSSPAFAPSLYGNLEKDTEPGLSDYWKPMTLESWSRHRSFLDLLSSHRSSLSYEETEAVTRPGEAQSFVSTVFQAGGFMEPLSPQSTLSRLGTESAGVLCLQNFVQCVYSSEHFKVGNLTSFYFKNV